MKIKTISYGLTRNLGNYQSARLDMTIEIEEGENWKEGLNELKRIVAEEIGGKFPSDLIPKKAEENHWFKRECDFPPSDGDEDDEPMNEDYGHHHDKDLY